MDANEAQVWNTAITSVAPLVAGAAGFIGGFLVERTRRASDRAAVRRQERREAYRQMIIAAEDVRSAMLTFGSQNAYGEHIRALIKAMRTDLEK